MTIPSPNEPLVTDAGVVTKFWWQFFSRTASALDGLSEASIDTGVVRLGSLQIAWGTVPAITTGTAAGSVFTGTGAAIAFPMAFSEVPAVMLSIVSTNGCFSGIASAISASGFTPRLYGSANTSVNTTSSRWLAIGRWR